MSKITRNANHGREAYRVRSRNETTPFERVKDGESAICWVREHAVELGVIMWKNK